MNEQHRKKVFYKKDGLLPYETRIGLLYEVPNVELLRELERRIKDKEIEFSMLACDSETDKLLERGSRKCLVGYLGTNDDEKWFSIELEEEIEE